MSEPEEAVPALVARVKFATPTTPRVDGGPPRLNAITQADVNKLNQDKGIEYRIMNQRNSWDAQPSEKNRTGQVGGFAAVNADLTFSRIAASPFSSSNYMRSRKIG